MKKKHKDYTEWQCVTSLQRAGAILTGPISDPGGSVYELNIGKCRYIGNKLWGMIDYLRFHNREGARIIVRGFRSYAGNKDIEMLEKHRQELLVKQRIKKAVEDIRRAFGPVEIVN